jgi:RHS repeat-associated protein
MGRLGRSHFSVSVLLSLALIGGGLPLARWWFPPAEAQESEEGEVEVPVTEFDTETSETVLNEDGTYTTTIYPAPINYQNPEGDWVPIDNTLVPSSEPGFAWENAANGYGVLLPANLQDGPVRMELGAEWIELTMIGAIGTGSVSESTATYAEALPGVSVSYRAMNQGVKEAITLAGPLAPAAFTFSLTTSSGLSVTKSAVGGLDFTDSSGDVLLSSPAPFVYDSSKTDEGSSTAVSLTLTDADGGLMVAVAIDPAWLADLDRVWPVVLDPTITAPDTQDCHIAGGEFDDQNLCSRNEMRVGWDGNAKRRMLLKFDVSSVPFESNILSADMALYLVSNTSSNSANYDVHRVKKNWTNGATWRKYDGVTLWTDPGGDFGSEVYATKSMDGTVVGWKHWYPSGLIQRWVDGTNTNQGLIIKQATENVNNLLNFASIDHAETSKWPYLSVTYSDWLGELRNFRYESQDLNDRMHVHVNVAGGNLVVHETDLIMAGTAGHDLKVERWYNSFSSDTSIFGLGWVVSAGPDVRLEEQSGGDVVYVGPSGFKVRFEKNGGIYDVPTAIDATLTKNGDNTYKLEFFSKRKMNFDTTGRLTSDKDRNDNTITYTYNVDDTLQQITDTHNRVLSFSYTNGRVTTVTDTAYSGQRVFTYAYDASNTKLMDYYDPVNASPKRTKFEYDPTTSALTAIVDPKGNRTEIEYLQGTKRVKLIRRVTAGAADDPTTNFSYDLVNKKTTVTDPESHATTYEWDNKGRLTKVVDAKGKERSTTYNSRSNVTTYLDAGQTLDFEFGYDPTGDDLTTVTLPTAGAATVNYGENGAPAHFPSSIFDFQDHSATATYAYKYDTTAPGIGNLTEAKDALGNKYTYAYNSNGTLDTITDPRLFVTDYNYFASGDLQQIIHPSPLGTTSFTFDAVSRVETIIDGKGQKTKFTYDKLDRVTKVEYFLTSGGPVDTEIVFVYDENGNLTSRNDNGSVDWGNIQFSYDELNRLLGETPPNGGTPNIEYTYDKVGNLKTVKDNGQTVTYFYDEVNMLDSLTDLAGQTVDFAYHSNRNTLRTEIVYPNGVHIGFAYDDSNRLCLIAAKATNLSSLTCNSTVSSALARFKYTYQDGSGFDTALRQSVTDKDNVTTTYTYDLVNRLTQADASTGVDYQYAYDASSNMTSKTVGGAVTSYAYNGANELCWSVSGSSGNACGSPPIGSTQYTFDLNGNEVGPAGGQQLTYNVRNQTVLVTPPGGSAGTMKYQDASQVRRMAQGTTTYGYNVLGLGVLEPNNGGGIIQDPAKIHRYVRDNSGVLLEERIPQGGGPTQTYYYLFDGLGSVVGLTDSSGALVENKLYKYEPYGKQLDGPTSVDNPWRFASGFSDSTSGFLKFGTRYLDPGISRWTQMDPESGSLKNPITLNRYLYVGSDPVNVIDPDGLSWWNPFSWSACTWFSVFGAFLAVASIVTIFVTGGLAIILTVVEGTFGVIDVFGALKAGCLS